MFYLIILIFISTRTTINSITKIFNFFFIKNIFFYFSNNFIKSKIEMFQL